MSKTAPLPSDPSEITPEWLTEALRPRFPDARVASVDVTEVREGTNSNARIRVDYASPCELPESFFLKLPPLDPARRESINQTGMGRREALFYQNLADSVPMRVPRPYVSQFDETSGAFVLLIEDLDVAGCTIPDPSEGITVQQAAMAMRDYAALHVRFEDEAVRKRDAGWVERMPRGTSFGPDMLQFGLDHHREKLGDAFAEIAELYIAHQPAIEEMWDRGTQTVIQGDSHIGNLFIDGGRPGFLDWGLIQLGAAIRDVGYFITMALTPERRRASEHELLATYLEERINAGGTPIEFDAAWLMHRTHAVYAVPAACPLVLFPDYSQDPAQGVLAKAFLGRSEAVVEDLDARGLLRDVLGI